MQGIPGHHPRQVSFGGDDGLPGRWCTARPSSIDPELSRHQTSPAGKDVDTVLSDDKPLDILTRATQAEARAEKAEADLLRTQKALSEVQRRQRDSNQLLRRLRDANVNLRAELERLRALCPMDCGEEFHEDDRAHEDVCNVSPDVGDEHEDIGSLSTLQELQAELRSERLEASRWQKRFHEAEEAVATNELGSDERTKRLLRLSENLESQLTLEASDAVRWRARCHELEEESFAPSTSRSISSAPAAGNAALAAEAQLVRAEVEALRHRVWSTERELQEKKQFLAVCQAEASRWQDKCLRAESRSEASVTARQPVTPTRTVAPRYSEDAFSDASPFVQEVSSLRGEAARNALALEAVTREKQDWEANTATAVAAAGRLERQEAALAVQLSMTQQCLEAVEERLAAAPSPSVLASSHEELRIARADAEANRNQLAELLKELQACEKALRGAEFELELERKAAPAASARAQNAAEAAERNIQTLRKTMQAEESLRLEVSRALTDSQREAQSLQISLHNEECALSRCSGDLVREMAVASSMQNELEMVRAKCTEANSDAGAMQTELEDELCELSRLESNARLQSEHWKAACQVRDEEIGRMRANLSEVYAEGNSMRQRLTLMGSAKDVSDRELPSNVELVQATCQELEARLEEECTQRSAAIAHAAQLMVQEAELTVEVASLKAAHLNTSSASATDISELEVEVASLRNQEKRLRDTESKAAKKIDDLSAEIAFLRCADGPLSRAEASEEKASDEAKELMAEVNSLRSLHEHAVQHGKSATLALRTLEKESAHSSQVSAASHTELLGQLHQYREMCSRLENAEAQLTWRLSSQEKNLSLEAKQAADYSAKCVAQASRVAKLEVLEEEEQMLAGRLEDRERLWSFELAGSNAAADAWRERCESQEASFTERYAVIQEAEKTCGALREAKEDAVRWRSRVQELHMERQHMESAIEALARARNSWHAKAEAAEHQMQNAVVATSSKAECMLQETHLQSQAEIAAVRSQFSESQARALCDLQEAQEKVMVVEQEAVERARSEASEVAALQESLTEAKAKADALERISEDLKQEHATLQEKLTGLAEQELEVAALRTSLSEANARSDVLKRQTEDLKQDNERLQERIVGLATESSEMQSKLQEQLLGQTQDASEVQVELVEKLTRQTEEADAMQSKLKQADRRFSASESGIEFLHTELSRTRRDSEQIWKALAVEQKEASGLRCRVRELETELEEHLGSMLTSRGPRGDSDFIVSMTPQPCVHKKLADDYRGCLSEPMPSLKDAMKLGALRQELRETKGGEPLSDMTGAWQRVQSLEARFSLVKDMKGVTQEEWINAAMTPDEYGNQPRISDACKEIVLHSPMGSPAFTETCRSLKYGVPPSSLKDVGVTPMEPDPLAASVASSSSVATRLSGCLSPVDWLVGRHEALGSPQNCDVGLQHLGGRSPERSPASQARSQPLALTASPSEPRRLSRSSHPNGSPMPERRGSPMPDRRVSASPLPNSSPIPRVSCSPLPNGSPMPERRGLRC